MSAAVERSTCKTCGRVFSEGERFCPFDRTDLRPERAEGSDPLIGTVLGGSYTLLERLSAGGMGVVYKGWQNRLERDVAIKVLSPALGGDSAAEDRFRTEALAVSRLANPHTVAVYDFGTTEDGLLYIVMKLVPGVSLRSRLARGPLGIRPSLVIATQICESLAEAHDRKPQIFHRDVKPDNVLVHRTPDGDPFVTVLDFGLAKLANADRLTVAGRIVGTPKYMAPEQAQGEKDLTARVDLYSLGVMLHEMVAGRPPFDAPNQAGYLYKHVCEPPPSLRSVRPDLSIPPELEALVLELLSKDPKDRPATAHVVRTRLLEILRRLPPGPIDLDLDFEEDPSLVQTASPLPVHEVVSGAGISGAGSPALAKAPAPPVDASGPDEPTLPPDEPPRPSRRRRVLSVAGAAGLLTIGLVIFFWKSAQGNAPPETPRVATVDPPRAPEPPHQAPVVAQTNPLTVDDRAIDAALDKSMEETDHVAARVEASVSHPPPKKKVTHVREHASPPSAASVPPPVAQPPASESHDGFIVVPR